MTLCERYWMTSADVLYGISVEGVSNPLFWVTNPQILLSAIVSLDKCWHNLPNDILLQNILKIKRLLLFEIYIDTIQTSFKNPSLVYYRLFHAKCNLQILFEINIWQVSADFVLTVHNCLLLIIPAFCSQSWLKHWWVLHRTAQWVFTTWCEHYWRFVLD